MTPWGVCWVCWIDGLSRSVHDILPDREVEAFGSDENPESLFGIFQDSAGFAVAALVAT